MRLKIVSIVCMVLLAAPVQAGWDEGWDAYKRRDYAAAVNEFMTLAEQGDVQAQVTLTIMFVFDEGARKFMNMKKVEKWFGVVRRQNFDKTLIWFRNAAYRGDTKAWTILGHLYSGDFGAPRKNDESTKWWLKAAVHGEVTAQKTLSHLFAYRRKEKSSRNSGHGRPPNRETPTPSTDWGLCTGQVGASLRTSCLLTSGLTLQPPQGLNEQPSFATVSLNI